MASTSARARGTNFTAGLPWNRPTAIAISWQTAALAALTVLAWGVFVGASIAQHRAYHTHAFDLSWFDQSAWNTARGDWMANSFSHGTYLKEHFSPIILLFGLVYLVWRTPEALLIIQATFAAVAAIPLYFAASAVLRSRTAAIMIAAAYLLSPHLHGVILFDFHPDILGVVCIFGSFALLEAGKPRAALAALAPVFLVKEDAALVGIGFAVLFWLYRYRRLARGLLLASFVYIILAEFVIVGIPHLLHWGGSGEQGRYAYLFKGGARDPELLWEHLTWPNQRAALAYITGSQALLPLAGPAAFVAAPDVLANVLADHKPQEQLTLQYPLYPLALLLVASVFNIRFLLQTEWMKRLLARLRLPTSRAVVVLAAGLLLAESVSWLVGSPLGLHVDLSRFRTTAHTAALERIVRAVPPGASVSAQSSILPHLSERANIREFPFLDNPAYIVIDRNGFRAWQSDVAGYDRILASLPERGYCLLKSDDGVELWAVEDLCEAP